MNELFINKTKKIFSKDKNSNSLYQKKTHSNSIMEVIHTVIFIRNRTEESILAFIESLDEDKEFGLQSIKWHSFKSTSIENMIYCDSEIALRLME